MCVCVCACGVVCKEGTRGWAVAASVGVCALGAGLEQCGCARHGSPHCAQGAGSGAAAHQHCEQGTHKHCMSISRMLVSLLS